MLKNLTNVTVALLGTVATSAATLPTPSYATTASLESKLQEIAVLNQTMTQETATKEVAPKPEKPKEMRLVCKGCNTYESLALEFLQSRGVTDKNALATIMGNIRQESTFIPNICEGGARVSYNNCRSGGYGLIQWTDSARYNGLGNFAYKTNANPSSIETQLNYMIHEPDWKMIEQRMMQPGGTISDYMRVARQWIRWGHHGARTNFAYDYAKRLVLTEV
jgi:hypothetical protein